MDPLLIFMLLAVGAMFLLTNRTRKQQRQAGAFRQQLQVGDEVMTGSGFFGTVIDIDGDVITLESPSGAQTDWLRAAIAKHSTPPYAEPLDEDGDDVADDMADGADDTARPDDDTTERPDVEEITTDTETDEHRRP